jgi:hypothetical protein
MSLGLSDFRGVIDPAEMISAVALTPPMTRDLGGKYNLRGFIDTAEISFYLVVVRWSPRDHWYHGDDLSRVIDSAVFIVFEYLGKFETICKTALTFSQGPRWVWLVISYYCPFKQMIKKTSILLTLSENNNENRGRKRGSGGKFWGRERLEKCRELRSM